MSRDRWQRLHGEVHQVLRRYVIVKLDDGSRLRVDKELIVTDERTLAIARVTCTECKQLEYVSTQYPVKGHHPQCPTRKAV